MWTRLPNDALCVKRKSCCLSFTRAARATKKTVGVNLVSRQEIEKNIKDYYLRKKIGFTTTKKHTLVQIVTNFIIPGSWNLTT